MLAAFADYGRGWNDAGTNPPVNDLYSVGAGLRFSLGKFIEAKLYYGYALSDVPEPSDDDLQDHGIHFSIAIRPF